MKLSENDPLELAEYFALGISVIGAIVANGLGQVIYAATPITLTLFLGIVNRNRLKQQVEQNILAEVNRLDKLQIEHSNITLAEVNRLDKLQQQAKKNNSIVVAEVGTRIERIPEMIRRIEDLSNQLNHISNNQTLLQQQIQQNIKTLLYEVGTRIERIPEIIRQIESLNRRFDYLNSNNDQSNEQIKKDLKSLEIKLSNLALPSSILLPDHIFQEIADLRTQLNNLNNKFNNYIKVDISTLSSQIDKSFFQTNEILSKIQPYRYELICGRIPSREKLREALQKAQDQERVIMVCPWITNYALDEHLENDIREALNRNVKIDIGWGHLRDIKGLKPQTNLITLAEILQLHEWKYTGISKLAKLQENHPDLLHLKLIGTHEKFLVCHNRSWALITSHNFLTSDEKADDREIGLWTDDRRIIIQLTEIYDAAIDKDKIRTDDIATEKPKLKNHHDKID